LSSRAMSVMVDIVNDILDRIVREASFLARISKKSTISAREISTAVRLIFPRTLWKHAAAEG
ncbi:histone-fold-containing protein, partial [Mycena alexandri]